MLINNVSPIDMANTSHSSAGTLSAWRLTAQAHVFLAHSLDIITFLTGARLEEPFLCEEGFYALLDLTTARLITRTRRGL
jgi:hypothetical protein